MWLSIDLKLSILGVLKGLPGLPAFLEEPQEVLLAVRILPSLFLI
jgi:hypothetical protein